MKKIIINIEDEIKETKHGLTKLAIVDADIVSGLYRLAIAFESILKTNDDIKIINKEKFLNYIDHIKEHKERGEI